MTAAPQTLVEYFNSGRFTGGRFERFAGGGDGPELADRITNDDIVAVSLLGVRVPGDSALVMLERRRTECGEDWSRKQIVIGACVALLRCESWHVHTVLTVVFPTSGGDGSDETNRLRWLGLSSGQ